MFFYWVKRQHSEFLLGSSEMVFFSSDRSSYSDDGLLYIRQRQWQQLFQIFTQSLDAIDVTSVTLSRLNSINAIHVIRCKLMLIECQMLQCSNLLMLQCFNVPIFQCSNDPMFKCSNVPMSQWSLVPMCLSFHRVARVSCPLVHWVYWSSGPLVH